MKNNVKYGCLFPHCNHRYLKTDGLRKHANKKHPSWIKGKKPKEYSYFIPREYTGEDYVTDYMTMIESIVAQL
jgi:hypothetical protein